MERKEQYHMSQKEMTKLKIVDLLLERRITVKKTAEILRLSARQVLRIKKEVKENGPMVLILKVNQNSTACGHENSRPQHKKIALYHPLCP
jgi:hypothetical protein